MSKERLEEAKKYFDYWMNNDLSRGWAMSDEAKRHLRNLIQQAERVQELERQYKVKLGQWSKVCQSRDKYEIRSYRLEQQNKRYREALEEIKEASYWDYGEEFLGVNLQHIAEKALEGEINDSERINKRTREI